MHLDTAPFKNFFNFALTEELLKQNFIQLSILLALFFSILAGTLGPFVISRNLSFASHGTSDLTLTGATFGLVIGIGATYGALLGALSAAIFLTTIKIKNSERDAITSVVISFGLGLTPLFLSLYTGKSSEALALITGQNIALASNKNIWLLAILTLIALVIMVVCYPQLLLISTDMELAKTNGTKVKLYNLLFAIMLGITIAQGVKIVGSLLVMALLVTPATAARLITKTPLSCIITSVIFSIFAGISGVILSLAPALPVSVFISLIAFSEFIICYLINRKQRLLKLS